MRRRITLVTCLLLLALGLASCKRDSVTPDTSPAKEQASPSDQFLALMNMGRNHLDQGDATNALATYAKAEALVPNDPDLRLNLANAFLLAGASERAIIEADEALKLDPNSAAAYFVKGSACLRLGKAEEALKALENSLKIDPGETATCFQLGKARMDLQQWDEAISAFKEGLALDPNHLHRTAHYLLGQALLRAGHQKEAEDELKQHQATAEAAGPGAITSVFEKSKHTQARVPFKLEQPDRDVIKVVFTDSTRETLGDAAASCSGPVAVIDANHDGWHSLFALETGHNFRLLWNSNGTFHPRSEIRLGDTHAHYITMLAGDLQNDRFTDVIALGNEGCRVFRFGTNGMVEDVSQLSRLANVGASVGVLVDLDFTGKLDLLAVQVAADDLRVFRQFGPLLFKDVTSASGIPASLLNVHGVLIEDWNRDGNMDIIVSREGKAPVLLEKQRGGPLVPRDMTNWVTGKIICCGDFDNDLRPDLAIANEGKITVCYNHGRKEEINFSGAAVFTQLQAIDYDNDGWLDLWASGETIRVWRNGGLAGFREQTRQLGLDKFNDGAVSGIQFADFDRDCDTDAVVALAKGGLRFLRNDGGNANAQVKVHLFGNRSNASGIGCKVEIASGGLRLLRTVRQLPVEIGVGKHRKLDSLMVHWLNWPQGSADVPFDCKEPVLAMELTLQEGSCPYLYAWDGRRFRFVTDILGAAPLGLPIAEGQYTGSDPEEYVWVGDETTFPPKDGKFELQITEELREVLYLDEAKLVVVDREPGDEVHPTSKLLPTGPFPKPTLLTLHNEHPLLRAETLDGTDVTLALKVEDGARVSPSKLRVPQLRGQAEPHGLVLDFDVLDTSKPLVLVMNGWIRFGGGMANIAASQDPSLPFPFPGLEAETTPNVWTPVDVTVGAPAGKTKTILVDLEGKLPRGSLRLRLKEAFEIHWDRVALLEKKLNASTRVTFLEPSEATLRFRGFSQLQNLPSGWPLSPDYDRVSPNSYWTIIPEGWCTRYGDVLELVGARDEGLALINAGEALSLKFAATSLPPKPKGKVRDFFLHVDGWDKDSDFHVAAGTTVEPLPFHGMDEQAYGKQKRPPFPSDELRKRYNTRWVEGTALRRIVGKD